MNACGLTVYSSFAFDRVVSAHGDVLSESRGGPALYLDSVFKNLDKNYILHAHPQQAQVEIVRTKEGDRGRALSILDEKMVQARDGPLVISSIADEWRLDQVFPTAGPIFVDIQGYMRSPAGCEHLQTHLNKLFLLKGTAEEMQAFANCRSGTFTAPLEISTQGSQGCEVKIKGVSTLIHNSEPVTVSNTIGAGDTFFAWFVVTFLQTSNALQSARHAITQTNKLLRERQ